MFCWLLMCSQEQPRKGMDETRSRLAIYLPATVEVGMVTEAVIPSAYQLAVNAKLSNPPPATLEGKPLLEKRSTFMMPLLAGTASPNALYSCAAVNGALMKVRTRTTIRRRRSATNEVLSETVLGVEVSSAHWCPVPITRECKPLRPLDFVYSPYSLKSSSPIGCTKSVTAEGDLYAPRCFLANRVVPSFDFGFDTQKRTQNVDARGLLVTSYVPGTVAQVGDPLPPQRSQQQREFANAHVNRPETRIIEQLLEQRPVWSTADLCSAMMRTGRCPNRNAVVTFIRCYTYTVQRGPFSTLRIAYHCDPTSDSRTYAQLQHITLRINRRSALGVAIRDTSRIPNIQALLELCPPPLKSPRPSQCLATTSMEAFTHRCVAKGALWAQVQIADLMDHPTMADEGSHYITSYSPTYGYYTEESIQRMVRAVEEEVRIIVMTHIPSLLNSSSGTTVLPTMRSASEDSSVYSDASARSETSFRGNVSSDDELRWKRGRDESDDE